MNRAISGIMAAMVLAVGAKAATHVEWKNEKVVVHCDKADEWDKNMRIDDALTWNNRPTACWEHAKMVSKSKYRMRFLPDPPTSVGVATHSPAVTDVFISSFTLRAYLFAGSPSNGSATMLHDLFQTLGPVPIRTD